MSASNYSRGQQASSGENDALYEGFGPVERGIVHFLKTSNPSDDGHHVKVLMGAVKEPIKEEIRAGRGANEAEVFAYVFYRAPGSFGSNFLFRNALDSLTTQGVLFSTLDEHHFTLV
jgi:hypothetical protein